MKIFANPTQSTPTGDEHIGVLDGWRAISILLVLWGHLLPAGPKTWDMNASVATMGMVLFFILSGFLITRFLLRRTDAVDFLIRRIFRILPLAWLFMVVALAVTGEPAWVWRSLLSFTANVVPGALNDATGHLWSLCVEMHFYLGVALLVAVGGRRALWALPVIGLAVTANRVAHHTHTDINTLLRVDEILAGATLALWHHWWGRTSTWQPGMTLTILLALLTFAASHPATMPLGYLRPYLAAALIGSTLLSGETRLAEVLKSRPLAYIAKISYALYVFHGGLRHTWLGSGDTLVRYLKRPLLFAVTFALAHLSTYHIEARFITMGRELALRWRSGKPS